MALCDDIVEHVTTLLNDAFPGHENTRWSRELVECAYNEAVAMLASLQPDAFVEVIRHKLEPGYIQTAPEECGNLVSVLGQTDELGNVMEPMTPSDQALARWFTDVCAGEGEDYQISSANLDTKSTNTFFVNPPVPYGAEVYALLQCAGGCGKNYENRCTNKTAIIEFMMYRLLGADETPTSNALATGHLQTFFNVVGLTLEARNAIRRGQYVSPSPPQG